MTDFESIRNIVLLVLAVYAAFLSTFNFIQAYKKDRRSIRITTRTAMPTYGSELGPPFVLIEATNSGHRAVSITQLTLRVPGKKHLTSLHPHPFPGVKDSTLPMRLSEGETANCYFSYHDVAAALKSNGHPSGTKITPIALDSLGNTYKGEPWTVDIDEWLTMGS